MSIIRSFFTKLLEQQHSSKESEAKTLEDKKNKIEIKIEEEKIQIDKNLNRLEQLKIQLNNTNKQYYRLLDILTTQGIIFDAENKGFTVKEWDNLYIKKCNGCYNFITKDGIAVYLINGKYSKALDEILSAYNYSAVITRVDNIIKIHFRIIK